MDPLLPSRAGSGPAWSEADRAEVSRVLVIEKDPIHLRELRRCLAPARGFACEWVMSVEAGAALLGERRFDVVLLGLEGEPCRASVGVGALRTAAPGAAIVVIARPDDPAAVEAVRAGAQDVLLRDCLLGPCRISEMHVRRVLRFAAERMRFEGRIAYLAEHDPLTGLANRACFSAVLERALARTRRSGRLLAVLFLDLDRFKAVNDLLGHEAGDRVLVEFADRLSQCLRESDTLARLGGDEFLVLLEDLAAAEDAVVVARKIRRAMVRPFAIGDRSLRLSTSIGIAVGDRETREGAVMIGRADAAMYRAKNACRGGYRMAAGSVRWAAGSGDRASRILPE